MPRLIAIDGPESGVALPVSGAESFLAPGPDRRVKLLRGGTPPAVGAAIKAAGAAGAYRIERLGAEGSGLSALLVNGEEVDAAALNHGDLVTFAGTTLIFDCDDHGATETTPGAVRGTGASGRLPKVVAPLRGPAGPHATEAPPPADDVPLDADSPEILGGESIRYRQKAYDDPHSLFRAVAPKDPGTRRLATLLKISAAVNATLDLPALLTTLLDLIFDELPADRGTILLLERPTKKLRSMVTRTRVPRSDGDHSPKVSRTIIKEALRSRESILTLDAMMDERFQLGESVAAAHIRSAMCVPIVRSGRVLGVVQVDTLEQARAFTREDLDLLTAIAAMAALAIENAKLYQEAAERERLRYELALASAIQSRLLPKTQPASADLDVFGTMVPAKELGGDYFDFIEEASGNLHVFVGDVSGKGVGAGLIMAIARSYFRPLTRVLESPRKILAEVNRLLYADTNREIFMSAVYLRWDGAQKKLVYGGAGQEHLLLVRAKTGAVEAIPAGGVALALVEEADEFLEDKELPLAPGDAVILYTDGVTEAREPSGAFYGLERLLALVREIGAGPSAKEIVERVVAAVKAFQGTGEQHDDVTVVALKRR